MKRLVSTLACALAVLVWTSPPALANFDIDDLSIDVSMADEHILLRRKTRRPQPHFVVISVIGVLVGSRPSDSGGPRMIDLHATITGDDAIQGSLLYALVWLAGDSDPLRSVRALGYDIDASIEHDRPCTDGPPGQVCVERARRLATLIDATLALGSTDERALFRQNAAALGVGPDCSAPVTQASFSVQAATSDIFAEASLADKEFVVSKAGKNRKEYLVVKMNDVNVNRAPGEPPLRIDLRAVIEGADADRGSLPYALAWLAGYPDPLGSVRALGYDIAVLKEHDRPCAEQLPSETCVNAARRLSTLIDATLGFGSLEERVRFRRDASTIGIAPDCSTRATGSN